MVSGDPVRRILGPVQIPAGQDDPCTASGENPGRLEAQARVRAGDDGRTPPLSWCVRLGPPAALAVPHRKPFPPLAERVDVNDTHNVNDANLRATRKQCLLFSKTPLTE